jgi:hypothetical protein
LEGTDEGNVPEYNSSELHLDFDSPFDAAGTVLHVGDFSDNFV